MKQTKLGVENIVSFPEEKKREVDKELWEAVADSKRKIIVLDDDPTGVQTVHDVSVYTDWSIESIKNGFEEENKLFFILTNSRSFTVEQTIHAHKEIAANIDQIAKEKKMEYQIISRADSTLRGHYPLETSILRQEVEKKNKYVMDGEILCPYFKEGGRFTIEDIHYVRYEDKLIPAAQTEFAKDVTFGYHSSNLMEYVEEKTNGTFRKENCKSISIGMLRSLDFAGIEKILCECKEFNKIIVNAMDEYDLKVFCVALYRAIKKGKHYTVRCAAALVKALGNISDKPLLRKEEMIKKENKMGGMIVVGSHTQKTTAQLEELKKIEKLVFLEMNSDLVLQEGELEKETERIIKRVEELICKGKTVCVSTRRTLLKVENDTSEAALLRSVKISNALQKCVGKLTVAPTFVIAKGGITSSDVGTKALRVKKAKVLGQIQPGIPVWQTGEESLFPGIPYVIFPGNVGERETLKKATQILL